MAKSPGGSMLRWAPSRPGCGAVPTACAGWSVKDVALHLLGGDLGKKIEKLTALAQPAIVFLMAGLVGTMAYLMMTAIFQTIGNISKR